MKAGESLSLEPWVTIHSAGSKTSHFVPPNKTMGERTADLLEGNTNMYHTFALLTTEMEPPFLMTS